MNVVSEQNILKVLTAFNPWWRTGNLRAEFKKRFKRFAFYEAQSIFLHESIRRTVFLTGIRRVGKTTIQYQLIDKLLEGGVNPFRIVYVSFDHPLLKLCMPGEILEIYHSNMYPDEDCFYFFDEVQYAADWDKWVKIIYDTRPNSRMVATGSSSPVLRKKAVESGVGRVTVLQVPTLSFFEYCELSGIENPVLDAKSLPSALVELKKSDLSIVMVKLAGIQKHFHRFLLVGGFPELALSSDDFWSQSVCREDIVDKVLKNDIPALYNIRNSSELERIFLYLCYYSSNIISIDALSKQLNGVSRSTVNDYIDYMESAGLIYRSYPDSMGGKKILKAKSKIYIADATIRNAVLMDGDLLVNQEQMGITVETTVYKHVKACYCQSAARVGYYRGAHTGNEIDIVVDFTGGKNLIEVKYRENASIDKNDAIFNMACHAKSAIVVTKQAHDFGAQPSAGSKQILRIPAFAFLYLLGYAEKHGLRVI